MNRIGLKIACVAVSFVIWIRVAATSPTEATIVLPVSLVNLSSEYTYEGSAVLDVVKVTVRGSKLRLLTHNFFNRAAGKAVIDLARETAVQELSRPITESDIQSDLTVLAIHQPKRLRLRIDRLVSRRLPVQIDLSGQLPDDRLLLEQPNVQPDSVTVSGPERFFKPELNVRTETIALNDFREKQQFDVSLVSPGGFLVVDEQTVQINILVASIEGRTLVNIPVIPLIDADQEEVAISPPLADVMVRGPADSVRALLPGRISATVPVSGFAEGIYNLPSQLEYPDWLTYIAIKPEQFTIVIGDSLTVNQEQH